VQNFKITLEYDGTRYSGWQIQKNARTVGGAFAESLAGVIGESPPVFAAGRTDSGVHAMAQVVSFRSRTALSLREMKERLNDRLPADINVLAIEPAPMSFHARHAALSRTYRYQVSLRRTAFGKRFVWWIRSPLDIAILHEGAAAIRETRDFASFSEKERGAEEEDGTTTSRILEASWGEEGELLIFRIRADRFLWRMVRRLVGSMIASSLGQVERSAMRRWLAAPSREPAKYTAPPSGLFLESVEYAAVAAKAVEPRPSPERRVPPHRKGRGGPPPRPDYRKRR